MGCSTTPEKPQPDFDLTSIPVDSWTPLFDGKTLDGWNVLTKTEYETGGPVKISEDTINIGKGLPYSSIYRKGKVPGENFEFELEAMRTEGADIFCGLVFPVGTNFVSMICGGWGNSVHGLSNVNYMNASENQTSVFREFKDKTWYTIKVRVTKPRVQVWIDGKETINQERPQNAFEPYPGLEAFQPLGIFTWETGSAFRNIRFRRIEFSDPVFD